MSNLFFDLHNGISGDMAVAAMLSLSEYKTETINPVEPGKKGKKPSVEFLKRKLDLLPLQGFELSCRDERREGILGKRFEVILKNKNQGARNYYTIKELIKKSALTDEEKNLSIKIFNILAEAEAKVHGTEIEDVHFHEIGAVDSIIDIVSFSVIFTDLNPVKVYASFVPLGSGKTRSMHGSLPLPAPATLEILKGLPVYGTGKTGEFTTPTGAAILKAVVQSYEPMPPGIIRFVGTGFGKSKKNGVNAIRVFEFNEVSGKVYTGDILNPLSSCKDLVVVIETTIDDSTPEEVAFIQETLLSEGALDVFITPCFMKKNRPGFNLTVLSKPEDINRLADTILLNSSTFGLRYQFYYRKYLERRIEKVRTEFGPISVKLGIFNGRVVKASPEYEDCRRAALKNNLPIRTIFEKVRLEAEVFFTENKSISSKNTPSK
ncbi:MAG: nickel pincer cofactor biosynthesis protein LarC [Spirochaetota bacterium]